ncbi:MAG: hypothetical protein JWO52_6001 [Gammaproteobacteria bacterium]|jgi:hypothetical protein|nr:hypothetical protein [Gammaproteobacteria bacterium]
MMQSWADYLDQLREGRIVEKPFVDPHHSPDVDPDVWLRWTSFRTDTRETSKPAEEVFDRLKRKRAQRAKERETQVSIQRGGDA